jgi:hypothetical protein
MSELMSQPAAELELVESYTTYVAGRRFYPEAAAAPGEIMYPAREPANPHDANAIALLNQDGALVGYLPRKMAAYYAGMIDERIMQLAARLAAPDEPEFDAPRVLTNPTVYVWAFVDGQRLSEFLARMGSAPNQKVRVRS